MTHRAVTYAIRAPDVGGPHAGRQREGTSVSGTEATRPNVARIYDYLLGGTENYDIDKRAAEELLSALPDAAVAAWDNREFLGRAVRFIAQESGIRQFVDIGTGLPTRGNVHSAVEQFNPDARIVCVDYDPEVVAHARSLLAGQRMVVAIEGDLRHVEQIFSQEVVCRLINFREPVAVLLVAILHFIRDDEHPYHIVDQIKDAIAPGSYLVISHVTADDITDEAAERARRLYYRASAPVIPRTYGDIAHFFDGLEILSPGVVNVSAWRSNWMPTEPGRTMSYAAVGRKP
jgi:trans-aconitate methyltransferase